MTTPPSWQAAHERAEHEDRDAYIDPGTGLLVMTASYLRRRGTCCASRCRHCPYGNSAGVSAPTGHRTATNGGDGSKVLER